MKITTRCLALLLACVVLPCAFAQSAPRFNHCALHVHDLKVSTAFYRDVIGLSVIPHPFPVAVYAWFAVGENQQLHLIAGADQDVPKDKMNHLSLSVPSVEGFIARLAGHKIGYENAAGKKSAVSLRPDGVHQIYFQDPDGNWIEINDAK